MSQFDSLQKMLETQFGPFIRDSKYNRAFDAALELLKSLEVPPSTHDQFYLFLHFLVIQLFEEIEELQKELSQIRDSQEQ